MIGTKVRKLPKASDLVVRELRAQILDQKLPVGTKLPSEVELAESFGLGRVTIREALRLLERDGLVVMKRGPSGGIFVRHPDVDQVSQAVALLVKLRGTTLGEYAVFRLATEPTIAALAAVNATEEQKQHLVEIASVDVPAGSSSATGDFHEELSAVCGNDFFALTQKATHVALHMHFREEKISDENRGLTLRAHEKIAKLVAAGDADGAKKAMEKHLIAYQEFIRKAGLEGESVIP